MAYAHHERLSALDAMFLDLEDGHVHMHVGAVALFEAAPLLTEEGGLDIDRVRAAIEASLHRSARFRQRLAHVPLLGHPVWVDDDRFNLQYHVRHTALPRPGDERLLKRLAGRIMSQRLDRGKPLWEMWFVEGLERGRFALISKIHHCLIDGVSGVDVLAALMGGGSGAEPEAPKRWLPRPAPGRAQLLRDEALRRARLPLALAGAASRALAHPGEAVDDARDALQGLRDALAPALSPTTPTPLNRDVGPHRRLDWTRLELAELKDVKSRLGGTLNDVVLAVTAGAVRRLLRSRGIRVEELRFRAMLPVSTRKRAERGRLGNRVAFLLAPLPLAEEDPRRCLAQIVATTRALKRSKQVFGGELLEGLSDWTHSALLTGYARLAYRAHAYNLVVTNVPGPPRAVDLLGARLLELHPVVPLFRDQALGIALFSYDGGLFWGFNSDWDTVPDLHDVAEGVQIEFERLRKAAADGPLPGQAG